MTITKENVRLFMMFNDEDRPNDAELDNFIAITEAKVSQDLETTEANVVFIAQLFYAKYLVLRGLAAKSLSKGYVQVNVEGRTITKAYQELELSAENVLQEYKEYLVNTSRVEVMATKYYDNAGINQLTQTEIIDMLSGVSNVEDLERAQKYGGFTSRRRL